VTVAILYKVLDLARRSLLELVAANEVRRIRVQIMAGLPAGLCAIGLGAVDTVNRRRSHAGHYFPMFGRRKTTVRQIDLLSTKVIAGSLSGCEECCGREKGIGVRQQNRSPCVQ
jgi:hypothetical protein